VLYLFFPPLVLFSRTLMSEVPSATLAVAALLLYGRGRRGQLAAGLLLGATLFLRYSNLALFVGLLVGVLAVDLQRRRNLTAPWLALGFLPGLMLFTV
jgi:4-amino-4-deoxy-L-arabinose transferase-like glycosyltransferase